MKNIKILNKISDKIYTVLDKKEYAVSETVANPDAILVRSADMSAYEVESNLKCIGRAGAGVNNIPIARMTESKIVVFNTPGANANAVKELTICGLLLASRDVFGGISWGGTLAGKGGEVPKLVEKGKSQFGGTEIKGKTLGIIGLGAIGVKVANSAIGMEMTVLGSDPYITDEQKALLSPQAKLTSFDEVIAKSDYISVHVPLVDSTRGMINATLIKKMKKGVVILNMSRAELANINDVKSALEKGLMRSYVVDFPTEEAINCPGIIAIPHLGASTEEAEENCAIMASESIKNYLENGNIVNSVNFPNITQKRESANRITIMYEADKLNLEKSLPDILRGFKYTVKTATRGNVGYAIIDSEFVIMPTALAGVAGILSIRQI
ncbi:MAG: 3-phosphoglycerate dehydrogenase [Firmicutes bacterium]|nr:3-phosphoglycerate dehydrogenase [Bacillota bacterium]